MKHIVIATEAGQCTNCGAAIAVGDSLKQVCFATGSTGLVGPCCAAFFPIFHPFPETGWEGSGSWVSADMATPTHRGNEP